MNRTRESDPFLEPPFGKDNRTWMALANCLEQLASADPADSAADTAIERTRREFLTHDVNPALRATFQVIVSVLCDLRLQGWAFRWNAKRIRLARAASELEPGIERRRVRRMHAVNRDTQLLKQSVREFVRSMEHKRLTKRGWVSIHSLMRDGRELAKGLEEAAEFEKSDRQLAAFKSLIQPYLQIVEEATTCEHTGLRLGDIWRYFRHTWANEYQTVPGRNIMLLVRDSAAKFHPVIGIAAIASPVVHLTLRDEWIGWAPQRFVAEIRAAPSASWAKWVRSKLEQLISGVCFGDLIRDRLIKKSDIAVPTEAVIARLEEEAGEARKRHKLHPTKAIHKNPTKGADDRDWRIRAETHLFRSKRCSTLAELLRAKLRLTNAGFDLPTKKALALALSTSEGRQAVETIRKHVKAIHIGNDVLDISVCGAIAPYSEILGGKLVAMLLASPEIVGAYRRRYGSKGSIIASSMAGHRVGRKPKLVALTTTSLYGAELNQYTRIRIPAREIGAAIDEGIAFKKLGLTRGQGSFHFSAVTVDLIEVLLSQLSDNRSVNSIFGEGVSPRLRKIRDGLNECGFPSDAVLTHGSPRIVYGVALTSNLRNYLLERASQPRYLLPQEPAAEITNRIADFWRRRWLHRRAIRPEIIERVQQHTLVSPIQHGARVPLPRVLDEEMPLFHQERW